MADTQRTTAQLQTLFAGNSAGLITAQQLRDFIVSSYNKLDDNVVKQNTCCLNLTENFSIGGNVELDATEGYGTASFNDGGPNAVTINGSTGELTANGSISGGTLYSSAAVNVAEQVFVSGNKILLDTLDGYGHLTLTDGAVNTIDLAGNTGTLTFNNMLIGGLVSYLSETGEFKIGNRIIGNVSSGELMVKDSALEAYTQVVGGTIVSQVITLKDTDYADQIFLDGPAGTITAPFFVGDGSGLTGVTAEAFINSSTETNLSGFLYANGSTVEATEAIPLINIVDDGTHTGILFGNGLGIGNDLQIITDTSGNLTAVSVTTSGVGTFNGGLIAGNEVAIQSANVGGSYWGFGGVFNVNDTSGTAAIAMTGDDGNITTTGIVTAGNGVITGGGSVNLDASGGVYFTALPTSDPEEVGRLWNDGGTVKISAG